MNVFHLNCSRMTIGTSRQLMLSLLFGHRQLSSSSSSPTNLLNYQPFIQNTAYIGGKWVNPSSGSLFKVFNPANSQLVGEAAECNVEDAREAVRAAKEAFPLWRDSTTAKDRAQLLRRLFELQRDNAESLAALITVEMGKPIRESRGEISYGASFLEWFAEEARRINGGILQSPWKDRQISFRREPSGVVAIITPWNFPNAMITRKIGAALAAGCTVVIKPPEDTPFSALALAHLAEQAGFPSGVINVVPTSREKTPEIGDFLCDSPDVSVISFTGSTEVGKHLINRSSSTVKRVCLELGGDAPFIVFNSADVDRAVQGCIAAKFRNAGQTCVCANRIFVQDGIHDQFVQQLSAAMTTDLMFGDPFDERTTIGPLINERAVFKVWSHVEDALNKGAKLLNGGKKLGQSDNCFFFEPTLLIDINQDMLLSKEETFGPIAAIHRFQTEQEALELANSSRRGLAGYFYSKDYQQIERVASRLEVGMLGINEGILSCAEAPFGGVKESGLGREGGQFGVDEFLNIKYVCLGGLC